MVWVYAPQLGLIAFATVLLQAAISGAPFESSITTALLALVVFYILGALIGETARRVVEDSVLSEFRQMMSDTEGAGTPH